LSHGMMLLLREYLRDTPFADRLMSASDVIRALRSRKTAGEVQRIRAAIATTQDIFAVVAKAAQVGMTELQISDLIHNEADRRGVTTSWERAMCPIVTTGPHSMIGHGLPSPDLKITPGGILHLDFGVRQDEYCSDIQRCWYVPHAGETSAPEAVRRALDAVVRAIDAAADAL